MTIALPTALALMALAATARAQADRIRQETDGLVVIEVESAAAKADWKKETAMKGFTGDGYYTWRGSDMYGGPGKGLLSWKINITRPGRYHLRIRNRHDHPRGDLHNDCFTRMDEGPWKKTYSSPQGQWTWASNHEYGGKKNPAEYTLAPGVHTFQISGRSSLFSIDRIHLYRDGTSGAEDASRPQSPTMLETMAGPGPYERLGSLVSKINRMRGLGDVLRSLRKKRESGNAQEKAEAERMFQALSGAALEKLEYARSLKDQDPPQAVRLLDETARLFSGDEIGKQAKQAHDALKADPDVQKELKAEKLWSRIEASRDRLRPQNGKKDPKDPGFRRLNARAIGPMLALCAHLIKTYPGTVAAGRAERLAAPYR